MAISAGVMWARFAHPNGVCLEDDMNGGLPAHTLIRHCYITGQAPLWNPYSFTGSPFLPLIQPAFYPVSLPFYFLPSGLGATLLVCLHKAIAAGGVHLYLRHLGFPRLACLAGGLVFMLSGVFTGQTRHFYIVMAAAWVPWLFLGWEWLRTGRKRYALVFLAGVLAMQVLAGRAETAARSALFLGMYGMLRPPGSRLRALLWLLAACALALALAMCIVAPVALGIRGTTRETLSYAMFCETSLSPRALIELVIPRLYGTDVPGLYKSPYWGPVSPWETASYVGALPLALGLIVAIRRTRRDGLVRTWVILAAAGLLLALGRHTPLHSLMYHVPPLNRFRAAARFVLFLDLALAVFFAVALRELIREGAQASTWRWLQRAGWALLSLAVLLAMAVVVSKHLDPSFFAEPLARALSGPAGHIRAQFDWTRPATTLPLVTALACGTSLLALARLRRAKLAAVIVLCLAAADLMVFAATFDGTSEFARARADDPLGVATAPANVQAAMRDTRMLTMSSWTAHSRSLMLPNTNLLARSRSFNGYSPLTPVDFERLAGFPSVVSPPVASFLIYENRLISTFGVAYLIGWDEHLGGAVRNWPWKKWAGREAAMKRHADLRPTATVGNARWTDGRGTLQKTASAVPALVFSIPGRGLSAYRCRFRVRAKEVCDGHLNMLAQTRGGRRVVLARHAIAENCLTSEFRDSQFVFVNPGYGDVELHFYTRSSKPIELAGLVIEEIGVPRAAKRADLPLARGGPSPYEIVHTFQPGNRPQGLRRPRFCIVHNRSAAPLVYLARRILPANSFDDALRILTDTGSDFSPGVDAILEAPPSGLAIQCRGGAARIAAHEMNRVEVECVAEGPSLLVYLDSYDPGWSATVNGRPAKIYRTNGLTKGVFVPAGHSVVTFRYFSPGLHTGLTVTALGVIICIGILVFPCAKRFLRRRTPRPSSRPRVA